MKRSVAADGAWLRVGVPDRSFAGACGHHGGLCILRAGTTGFQAPREFGKGAIEGVAGPESANNAAAGGAMIPLLSLGLPFTPATAVLLGGMLLHGITPGPFLLRDRP